MKARRLIDGAAFGPEALEAIGKAFDAAWEEIAGNFGNDPRQVEAARLKLASAMLSITNEESRDVEVLKQAALERLTLDYRVRATA
jgi:hypothetical protein